MTLHGADLLRIDGALPGVTMTLADGSRVDLAVGEAGGCEPLEAMGGDVERVQLRDRDAAPAGHRGALPPDPRADEPRPGRLLPDVDEHRPGRLVPPPDVAEVQPLYLCRNVETGRAGERSGLP
ncbi:MAG: hypothetical protein R3F43_15385 [bacterium]